MEMVLEPGCDGSRVGFLKTCFVLGVVRGEEPGGPWAGASPSPLSHHSEVGAAGVHLAWPRGVLRPLGRAKFTAAAHALVSGGRHVLGVCPCVQRQGSVCWGGLRSWQLHEHMIHGVLSSPPAPAIGLGVLGAGQTTASSLSVNIEPCPSLQPQQKEPPQLFPGAKL